MQYANIEGNIKAMAASRLDGNKEGVSRDRRAIKGGALQPPSVTEKRKSPEGRCACVSRNLLVRFKIVTTAYTESLSLVVTGSLNSQSNPTKAVSHCWGWGRRPVATQSTRLAALAVPICCQKPGVFLESRWPLIHDES